MKTQGVNAGGQASGPSLPQMALSIRQPWAWLIVHGHKDIENRTWPTKFRGPVWIHAGQTMTKADYEACVLFIAGIERKGNWRLPAFDVLKQECGGIVGSATITDCLVDSASPWFVGDYGFRIAGAQVVPFQPCKGALGFFTPNVPGGTPSTTRGTRVLHEANNLPVVGPVGQSPTLSAESAGPATGESFAAGPDTYPVAQAAPSAVVPAAVLTEEQL